MWGLSFFFIWVSIPVLTYLFWLFLRRCSLVFILKKWGNRFLDALHLHQHLRVPQFNQSTNQENKFYRRVSLYVNSLPSLEDSDYANIVSHNRTSDILLSFDGDRPIEDDFLGSRVWWVNRVESHQNGVVSRSFVLKIRKKDKRRILQPYLQHILEVSGDVEERRKQLKIYSNIDGNWNSAPFDHPASFDTVVIDPEVKSKIRHDLEVFMKSEQDYRNLGRVWKRSYLLYGPSGTGKSSFIAATANLLNYDIYNLNLWQVAGDADLNSLLLKTAGKSLVVVEDFDLYLSESSKSRAWISTSSVLNFMDGLLNSQSEKITIFTMNSKDGIDSVFLRPGRIDVHICFPLCDFNSFKNLASNYLSLKDHKLFPQVEEIFQSGTTMSPAEISELMLVNRSSPSRALRSVISALRSNSVNAGRFMPRIGGTTAASLPPFESSAAEGGDGGCIGWKVCVPKHQFSKLYGLLGAKSCRKIGPSDVSESETLK